jgi:hypothetical protein
MYTCMENVYMYEKFTIQTAVISTYYKTVHILNDVWQKIR